MSILFLLDILNSFRRSVDIVLLKCLTMYFPSSLRRPRIEILYLTRSKEAVRG